MIFDISVNGRDHRVELEQQDIGNWLCTVDGDQIAVNASATASGVLSLLIAGQSYEVVLNAAQQQIIVGRDRYAVEVRDPRSWRSRRARTGAGEGPKKIIAPMPGKVVRVIAPENSEVEQGGGVVVIEAMKMQNELKSPKNGRVAKLLAVEGAAVNAGDVLAVIE
jgi:biotin carboxyl carrier protein